MRSREEKLARPPVGSDGTTAEPRPSSAVRNDPDETRHKGRSIEDTNLPVVMTSNPATMRILETLSTHKSGNGRRPFLPMHVLKPSSLNAGYDFGSLPLNGRKIFLLGPDLNAVASLLRQRGAQLYDLEAAAAGGFETLDHCLATGGLDRGLEFFDRAEQYFNRHVPEGFRLFNDGVYWSAPSQGQEPQAAAWISSAIYVKAFTRDAHNQNWGKLIEFCDKDGYRHRSLIPMSALAANGAEWCAQLLNQGLRIAPGRKARELVIAYILHADPEERVRSSSMLGWHDSTFVLPDESIQPDHGEPILYQNIRNAKHSLASSGMLHDWIDKIGRYCPGNPRLVFAVSCGFGAPLLRPMNEPGGGFNFSGASSSGKTTALLVAASVWGGNGCVRSWRMTANSIDAVAAHYNDRLLCVDELTQADPKEVGSIVYALGNGSPKQRMSHAIVLDWNSLILSSGETSLTAHMQGAGKQVHRGQTVRLCDLEADAGSGLGLFNFLHGFANSSTFARHLAESTRHYHGTPIRPFLQMLVKDRHATTRTAIGLRDQFLKRHVPGGTSGEVRRAASRFALVAAAGELATAAGITGWQEGDSMFGAQVCFESWLSRHGGSTIDTTTTTIRRVRHFLETHESLRKPGIAACDRDSSVAGFRVGKEGRSAFYFLIPEVFRREVCAGSDPKVVLQTLKAHGYLEHDNGRLDKSVRLAGAGKTRVYAIKTGILGTERGSLGNEDNLNSASSGDGGDTADGGDSGDNCSSPGPIRGRTGDGSPATQLRGTDQE